MVGRDKGPGGSLVLIELSKNALKLQEEVSFLYEIMKDKRNQTFFSSATKNDPEIFAGSGNAE